MQPFHLAFPVTDLAETERFYVEVLGCEIGRRTPSSINFNFGGHQIVAHEVIQMPDMGNGSGVDGKECHLSILVWSLNGMNGTTFEID